MSVSVDAAFANRAISALNLDGLIHFGVEGENTGQASHR
jgi:hypothetical protein